MPDVAEKALNWKSREFHTSAGFAANMMCMTLGSSQLLQAASFLSEMKELGLDIQNPALKTALAFHNV